MVVSRVEQRPHYASFCDYAEHLSDLFIACYCNALAQGRPMIWKEVIEPAFAFIIHASFEPDTADSWPPTTAASTIYEDGTYYVHLDQFGRDRHASLDCVRTTAFAPRPPHSH
jgi:hypothetical protein